MMTRVLSLFRFTIVTCFLSCSVAVHPQPMSIAINGDPSAFPRPGINSPQHPHPPPPQTQAIKPITALLGNLFGGLGGLTGFNSNPVAGHPPLPPIPPPVPGPMSPSTPLHYMPQIPPQMMSPTSPDVIREQQRIQLPTDCSVTTIPGDIEDDFNHPHHLTKSYKSLKYKNRIDSDASATNRSGICVANSYECNIRQGDVIGPCLGARPAPNLPRSQVGVCCNSEVTCGQVITMNGTYFKSPKFPNPYTEPGSCSVSIKNTYKNICQIRLDFDVFNLKQPVHGNCNSDRFVVSGHPNNVIVPSICGYNAGQHS